jgi:hypothetical protein
MTDAVTPITYLTTEDLVIMIRTVDGDQIIGHVFEVAQGYITIHGGDFDDTMTVHHINRRAISYIRHRIPQSATGGETNAVEA